MVKRFNYYGKRAEKFHKALQNLLCPNPLLVVATNTQFYCHGGECTAIANTYFPTKKNCVKNSKMPLPDATFLRSLSLYGKKVLAVRAIKKNSDRNTKRNLI